MIWMPMYIHIIFSYLAAVGFAVFLNAPKKTLYISGGIGMISWVIYILLMRINIDTITSNFISVKNNTLKELIPHNYCFQPLYW